MLTVQNATRGGHACVPAPRTLRRWAQAAMTSHTMPACVTVRVVGTAEGRQLNRTWRGRDYATNVLSFTYGEESGRLQGDLVLCAPVLAREAKEQGKRLIAHYAHLVVHGLLHLQGEDHEDDKAARRMEARERRILKSLGYADPYRNESE